jgi:hypothetical protein
MKPDPELIRPDPPLGRTADENQNQADSKKVTIKMAASTCSLFLPHFWLVAAEIRKIPLSHFSTLTIVRMF